MVCTNEVTVYACEVCNKTFKRRNNAIRCEHSHGINEELQARFNEMIPPGTFLQFDQPFWGQVEFGCVVEMAPERKIEIWKDARYTAVDVPENLIAVMSTQQNTRTYNPLICVASLITLYNLHSAEKLHIITPDHPEMLEELQKSFDDYYLEAASALDAARIYMTFISKYAPVLLEHISSFEDFWARPRTLERVSSVLAPGMFKQIGGHREYNGQLLDPNAAIDIDDISKMFVK